MTLLNFTNPSNKLTDGTCCSTPGVRRSADFLCPPDSCHLAVVVCLKQYQKKFTARGCIFGEYKSLIGSREAMVNKTQAFILDFTWPVSKGRGGEGRGGEGREGGEGRGGEGRGGEGSNRRYHTIVRNNIFNFH